MNCKVNSNITSRSIDPYTRNVPMTSYSKIIAIAAFQGNKKILDMLLNFKNWFITTDYTLIILVVSFLVYCEKQGKDDRDLKQCLDYCVGHRYNGYDISELLANGDGKNLYLYINSPLFKKLVYVAYGISNETKDKETKDKVDTLIKNLANRAKRVTQFLLLKSKVYGLIDLVFKYGKIDDLIGGNISKSRKPALQPPAAPAPTPKPAPQPPAAPTPNPAPPPSSPSSSSAAPAPTPKPAPQPPAAPPPPPPPPSSSSAAPAPTPKPASQPPAAPPPPPPPPSSSSAAPAPTPKPAPQPPAAPPPPPPQGMPGMVSPTDAERAAQQAQNLDREGIVAKTAGLTGKAKEKRQEERNAEEKAKHVEEALSPLMKKRAAQKQALEDMAAYNAQHTDMAKQLPYNKDSMVALKMLNLSGDVPYAAYHLYTQKLKGDKEEGFFVLPFPRIGEPSSYEIIRCIKQYCLEHSHENMDVLFNQVLHDVYEGSGYAAEMLRSSLPKLFERPTDLEKFAKSTTKIYVRTETGPNGASEFAAGVDRYWKDMLTIAKTIALKLVLPYCQNIDDIYAPADRIGTMSSIKDGGYKMYSLTHEGTTLYLFTDESTNEARNRLSQLFNVGRTDKYVSYEAAEYICDVVVNYTALKDRYLQELPKFLTEVQIVNINDVQNLVKDKAKLDLAAAAREQGKKEASEQVAEAEEQSYLEGFNWVQLYGFTDDFAKEKAIGMYKKVFKQFYKNMRFNSDNLNSVFEAWKNGIPAKLQQAVKDQFNDATGINTNVFLGGTNFISPRERLQELYAAVMEKLKNGKPDNVKEQITKAVKAYIAVLTNDAAKTACKFLFTLALSTTDKLFDARAFD